LCNARAELTINVSTMPDAIPTLPLSTSLIFERTGRVVKSHGGVHSEFARIAKDEPKIDRIFPVFLTQACNLKAVAE
jgi:hypothetical protein